MIESVVIRFRRSHFIMWAIAFVLALTAFVARWGIPHNSPKRQPIQFCDVASGHVLGSIHGPSVGLWNSSDRAVFLEFSVETNEGGKWNRMTGGFGVEGDCRLEPGQARNFTVQPFGGAIPEGSSWKIRIQARPELKGVAALPMWFNAVKTPAIRKAYKSIWRIAPFGTGVVWGPPEGELISDEIR
ncbi:MAG: hypothetical protein JWM99_1420 [Verrucomicrobiales bacterium]|nr:hypothetical protein [Verrucomicrobiales bacterium]